MKDGSTKRAARKTDARAHRIFGYPMKKRLLFAFPLVLFSPQPLLAYTEDFLSCIEKLVETAPDAITLKEMKSRCLAVEKAVDPATQTPPDSPSIPPASARIAVDESNIKKPFTLMSHRPNYLLPISYNSCGWDSSIYQNTNGEEQLDLDNVEVQFQISIKMPLATDILKTDIDAYAGYTMQSFWQAYNSDNSAPFRETNHQPEVWLQRRSALALGPLKNVMNGLGIVHHSNGQGGALSRSWNRVYASFGFELGNLAFLVKPWLRIEEDDREDNNPDITDYLGHGELALLYKQGRHTFSLLSRNNFESGFSKGAVQLGWSFPLLSYDYLRGYLQYFEGYGESLIDYNHRVNHIGLGLLLTN